MGKVCMEGTCIFGARGPWATGGGLGCGGGGCLVGQHGGERGDGSAKAGRTVPGRPKEGRKHVMILLNPKIAQKKNKKLDRKINLIIKVDK